MMGGKLKHLEFIQAIINHLAQTPSNHAAKCDGQPHFEDGHSLHNWSQRALVRFRHRAASRSPSCASTSFHESLLVLNAQNGTEGLFDVRTASVSIHVVLGSDRKNAPQKKVVVFG